MITSEQLSHALTRECDITTHLFGKLPAGKYDYRPSPEQRSTLELLRYLSVIGIAGMRSMAEGKWEVFQEYSSRVENMPGEEFPAAMARQKSEIEEFFRTYDERTLATQEATLPWRATMPLGAAIVHGPVKWLAAYKLQLFLYVKASGVTGIGTANAWAGMDMPPPTAGA